MNRLHNTRRAAREPEPTRGQRTGRRRVAVLGALMGASMVGGCSTMTGNPAVMATTTPTPASTSSSAAPSGGEIPVGPGPRSRYTVQPQPPAGSCHYRYEGAYPLPDPACTPGATNPRVTQANLATTICRGGYTSSVRPPARITRREKAANARSYGYTGSFTTGEYDHLISLELGGDPNDPRNLWVEPNDRPNPRGTANSKDTIENAAHTAICSGRLTLAQAQRAIATDWPALGRQLSLP